MPADALPALANDADWRVRYEVARRAAPAYLAPLAKDEDPMVSEIALERLRPQGGADRNLERHLKGALTMGTNISRDSNVVELNDPPIYTFGEKVRARKTVRNDGTYAGKDIGDILCKKGDEGFVVNIGTFLQQFYIYGVEFPATGNRVGMKSKELDPVETSEEKFG